jgi:hypothetical protein
MKNLTPKSLRFIPAALGLVFCLLANHAGAQQGWDPNGTTSIGGSGTWDTTTQSWTPNGTETQVASGSLVAFGPLVVQPSFALGQPVAPARAP